MLLITNYGANEKARLIQAENARMSAEKSTIVAPDGRFSAKERHNPAIVIAIHTKIEAIINFFMLLVNCFTIEDGIVSRAMTKIMPTTFTRTTTLKATPHNSMK